MAIQDQCIEWDGTRVKGGYGILWKKGHGRHELAHRQVYEEHHGEIPKGMRVLHRCDNPPCVNIDHLFLGTQGDNMTDMYRKRRHRTDFGPRGEKHWNCKLSDEQVREIRRKLKTESTKGLASRIAKEYGVSQSTINAIRNRKSRRSV